MPALVYKMVEGQDLGVQSLASMFFHSNLWVWKVAVLADSWFLEKVPGFGSQLPLTYRRSQAQGERIGHDS